VGCLLRAGVKGEFLPPFIPPRPPPAHLTILFCSRLPLVRPSSSESVCCAFPCRLFAHARPARPASAFSPGLDAGHAKRSSAVFLRHHRALTPRRRWLDTSAPHSRTRHLPPAPRRHVGRRRRGAAAHGPAHFTRCHPQAVRERRCDEREGKEVSLPVLLARLQSE